MASSSSSISANTSPPEASQLIAWQILGPEVVGWGVQIFITGACCQKAADFYSKHSTLSGKIKVLLASVLVLNLIDTGITFAELLLWSVEQNRSQDSLFSYKVPDVIQPITGGLVSILVQGFFAARAWRILNKNMIFLILISIVICASFVGALGLAVVNIMDSTSTNDGLQLLSFTELYAWTAVAADSVISVTIIFGLMSKKTGFNTQTDSLAMKIINGAMQSALLTTAFALSSAIAYAISWDGATVCVTSAFFYPLPSVYTYSLLWCLDCTDQVRRHQSRIRGIQSSAAFSQAEITKGKEPGRFEFMGNALDMDFSDVVKQEECESETF